MAAPTTYQAGIDFRLKSGSDTIGGGVDARLRYQMEPVEVTNKTAPSWQKNLPGVRSWGIEFDTLYMEGSDEEAGSTMDITVGGTSLKGVTQATLQLQAAFDPIVNTTVGLDREIIPTVRSVTLQIQADYYDPAGTGATALDALLDEIEGSTSSGLAVVFTFGSGASFTATMRPTRVQKASPVQGHATVEIDLTATGAVTDGTTGEDAGIGALLTAFFGASAVGSITADFTPETATYTHYTGTVYPTSLTFTAAYSGRIDISGVFEGHGAITRAAISA